MEVIQHFDGKALLICIFAWAALFSAIRAWRYKKACIDIELAYNSLAQENIRLRSSLYDQRRYQEPFTYPESIK